MPYINDLFSEEDEEDYSIYSGSDCNIYSELDEDYLNLPSDSDADIEYMFKTNYAEYNISDSDSDSDLEPIIKCPRIWLSIIIDVLPEKWTDYEHYIKCCDHFINSKKDENITSNKQFTLIFKKINDYYLQECPELYKIINTQIITQYRHKFLMERHSKLI